MGFGKMVYWVIAKVPLEMEAYSYQMVNLTLKSIPLKTESSTFQFSTIPLFHRTRQKLSPRLNISIFNKLYKFRDF